MQAFMYPGFCMKPGLLLVRDLPFLHSLEDNYGWALRAELLLLEKGGLA